ncbi:protealysin inhibitor emfourin [Salinicola avicenniae]|uniref:protealysin inhibitor emfourin n=1 Tax=Salinicola avicenniae TaxID=2916836 RepID=UPI002073E671|nr:MULTISPECIES: protealysin inhibitor emfourin [unclassified Salinicola]
MSSSGCPPLAPDAVLAVSRDGGFAAMPGLNRERRIDCRTLSPAQRQRLQAVLAEVERQSGQECAPGADRRVFRVVLLSAAGQPDWERELDESLTPKQVIGLWKLGMAALES